MRGQTRLLVLTLVLVAAVTWAHQARELLPIWVLLGMITTVLLLIKYRASFLLTACVVFVAAYGYTQIRATWRLAEYVPIQTINVTGTIASMPTRTPYGVRFIFAPDDRRWPQQISTAWNDDDVPSVSLKVGQEWRLPLGMHPPRATQNEGVFDQEQNWLAQNIRGFAVVRLNKNTPLADYPQLIMTHYTPATWLHNTRASALAQIDEVLLPHDASSAAVFKALTFGAQDEVTAQQWALFQQTGVTHLVSISGVHITMLAGLLALCINWAWRKSQWLCGLMPSWHAAQWAGLLLALIYALFTGWALPAQRTVYMLALWLFLSRIGVAHSAVRVVCLALCGVLLFDPFAVLTIGFWLSFGAVVWLILAFEQVESSRNISALLGTQLAIGAAMLPATLYFFHQASMLGVLVNLIAIPLVSVVLVPLLLGSSIVLFVLGWSAPMIVANSILAACINGLAMLPSSLWVKNLSWQAALLMTVLALGLIWMVQQRRWWRVGGLSATLLAIAFVPSPTVKIAQGQVQVHVLDIGQGTAVLLQTATQNWLYDTGPRYGNDSDAGARVIVPYLRAHGVSHIDTMILSHNDTDHTGGAASVARLVTVDKLLTSIAAPDLAVLDVNIAHVTPCEVGQHFEFDGVVMSMLSPDAALRDNPNMPDNSKSCILRIDAPSGQWRSILLTGDVDGLQEARLVVAPTGGVRDWAVDVLMMAHHGSGSSSTQPLIDATRPKMVFAQAGYLNAFHHPHPNTLQRYRAAGADVQQTVDTGTLRFCIGCDALNMVKWRDAGRRYWW